MGEGAAGAGRPRKAYRTRNWRGYDRGLVARGDLTVWISPDLTWHAGERGGKRGRPQAFTDAAIQAVLAPKVLSRPPPRAAQGMAGSLIRPAGLDRRVPHSSTLPRRRKDLVVAIPYRRPRGGPPRPVIDGTGLKVPGEGEWKVRKHGAETRRAWRRVHLGVDADSREVRAVEVTDHRHGDGEIVPGLLARLPEAERIAVISGDGGRWCTNQGRSTSPRPALGVGDRPPTSGRSMPYKANEARCHTIPRARYRVTNWPEYDRALQRRGSLTVWVTPEALAAWHPPKTGRRGRSPQYADLAIETG